MVRRVYPSPLPPADDRPPCAAATPASIPFQQEDQIDLQAGGGVGRLLSTLNSICEDQVRPFLQTGGQNKRAQDLFTRTDALDHISGRL
jgi:hypothetical protein